MYTNDELTERLKKLVKQVATRLCAQCRKPLDPDTNDDCPTCGAKSVWALKDGTEGPDIDWAMSNLIHNQCHSIDEESETEDWLNKRFGEVSICDYKYEAGTALKEIDPTAFRCEVIDFVDNPDRFVEVDEEYYLVEDVQDMIEGLIYEECS